jgi:hypothetical protein
VEDVVPDSTLSPLQDASSACSLKRARAHTLVEEEEEEWLELDGVRGLVVLVVAVGDGQCGQPS